MNHKREYFYDTKHKLKKENWLILLYFTTTLMAESEEELNSLLLKVKEESENVGLKLNIQKTKIMASGPITSWEIDGETVETVAGSKITADGDCSHEIKRRLLLGRKVMANLDSILKSRDITLPTKVRLVKAMVFPVVMYGCESWTIKKPELWGIDAFELWCWRRLLRVPWTARRSNQSILKEISPGCSLEGLTLKLKLQYFGHLMRRADSFEKTLMLGGIEGRRRRGRQRMRWLNGITDSIAVYGVAESWTRLSDWTEPIFKLKSSVHKNVPNPNEKQDQGSKIITAMYTSDKVLVYGLSLYQHNISIIVKSINMQLIFE